MAESTLASPPTTTAPALSTATPATPTTPQAQDDVAARAFVRSMARDVGIILGEPDLKKAEKPAPATEITPQRILDAVPLSELAKRKREAQANPTTPASSLAPAAATPSPSSAPPISAPPATPAPATAPSAIDIPPGPSRGNIARSTTTTPLSQVAPPDLEKPTAPTASDNYEETLPAGHKEAIDYDRNAERLFPDKFKGMSAKRVKFLKSLDEFAAQNPDLTEDDERLKSFIEKHRPEYTDADRRQIDRALLKEEVLNEARKETEGKLANAEREIRDLKVLPQITQELETFEVALTNALPENLRAKAMEKELEELDDEFPLEAPLARNVYDNTLVAANEFLELARGVKQYRPGENETHEWLLRFINSQGDYFKQKGGEAIVRDGKRFVPRAEYTGDPATWTFSDKEVLDMLAANAEINLKNLIEIEKTKHQKIASRFNTNTNQLNPVTPAEQPTPSPRAPSRPAPGIGETVQEVSPLGGFFKSLGVADKPT